MKIVIDKAIPFVSGVFEPYSDVVYLDGSNIGPKDICDADALIIRSRTRCDAALLDGSKVKIIATATIGKGHIDTAYCESRGIFVTNSSGSNATAVMNYVFSSLYGVAARRGISLTGSTIGVIGAGHVGNCVLQTALKLGFKTLVCDTKRESSEGVGEFCKLETLLSNSDIVSLHVPLTPETEAMAGDDFFMQMKHGAVFINAANGFLVDDDALIRARAKLGAIIVDTWRNEPDVNLDLLNVCDIATPHIAGYSYKGKQLSTMMAVRSTARFFGITGLYDFFPSTDIKELESVKLDLRGLTQGQMASTIQYNYPVFTDDFFFRVNPEKFKELRAGYSYRKEFYLD